MNKNKFEQIIISWESKKEANLSEVLNVLSYLKENYNLTYRKAKTGSHYICYHDILKNLDLLPIFKLNPNEFINGEFSIATIKGKKVKKVYLNIILKVYEMLKFLKEKNGL